MNRIILLVVVGTALALSGRSSLSYEVNSIPFSSSDIIYDPVSQKIYASVPGNSDFGVGNTVTVIDPISRVVESSVFIGSEPGKLAVSDNGQYLYVALDGAAAVRRYNIATQKPEIQFSTGEDRIGRPLFVRDIEVLPGQSNSVAISRIDRPSNGNEVDVAIFDNGVIRPNTTAPFRISNTVIEVSDTVSELYAYNNTSTGFDLSSFSISTEGLQIERTSREVVTGFGVDIEFEGGRLFATSGQVVDTETLLLQGSYDIGIRSPVEPDSINERTFFLVGGNLKIFDQNTFTLVDEFPIEAISGTPTSLIKIGEGKLAFRTSNDQLYFIDATTTTFQGNIVVSLDVSNGLSATGGSEVDTVLIESGVMIANGVDLNNFPLNLTNHGIVEGGIVFDESGELSNSGIINSSGIGVRFGGASTVINSGTITGDAGVAISTGIGEDSVILRTGSVVSGDIDMGDDFDTVTLLDSGSLVNNLINVEKLIMEGTQWSVDEFSNIDNTEINNGTLRINSTFRSSVAIGPSGILGGNSVVTGDISNNGTISPGNSIGSIVINGDLIHAPGSDLSIEFSNTSADFVDVSGHTALEGGNLTLIALEPVTSTNFFTILRSGTLTGQFGKVTTPNTPAVYSVDINFSGSDIHLLTKRNAYESFATDKNQTAIGTALQNSHITATGDHKALLLELDSLMTETDVKEGLDRLSPDALTAFPLITFGAIQEYTDVIFNHLTDSRIFDLNRQEAEPDSAVSAFGDGQIYMLPYRTFSDLGSEEGFTGFKSATTGILIGFDRNLATNAISGISLGWASTSIDWDGSAIDGDIESIRLAGYCAYSPGKLNLNGIASFGFSQYEADRRIKFGTLDRVAKSDHGSQDLSIVLKASYKAVDGKWNIGPVASLGFIGLFEESYSESGAGAAGFDIEDEDNSSLSASFGIHASTIFDASNQRVITPIVEFGWRHEVLDNEYSINAEFQEIAGNALKVHGRDLGNSSYYFRTGITLAINNLMLGLRYKFESELGRGDYNTHSARATITFSF